MSSWLKCVYVCAHMRTYACIHTHTDKEKDMGMSMFVCFKAS